MHTHHSGQKIQKSLIDFGFWNFSRFLRFQSEKKIVNVIKRDFFD